MFGRLPRRKRAARQPPRPSARLEPTDGPGRGTSSPDSIAEPRPGVFACRRRLPDETGSGSSVDSCQMARKQVADVYYWAVRLGVAGSPARPRSAWIVYSTAFISFSESESYVMRKCSFAHRAGAHPNAFNPVSSQPILVGAEHFKIRAGSMSPPPSSRLIPSPSIPSIMF